ncbi:MAG TPA: hypothetical protein VKA89_12045 [Solirubrobacterales bacterium]|nr:hypothetical protein [Solirubrobacterales bacterium]
MNERDVHIPAWALPFVVLAIAVPVIAAFAVGGPGLGLMIGAVAAVVVVVFAARLVPRGQIAPRAGDGRRRLLVVAAVPIDQPEAIRRIAAEAEAGEAEVRVLAPARFAFLDRWASDVGPARDQAQRDLVISVANLGKAQVEADARVGDEGVVQAVEDQLADYPATEVILATGEPGSDPQGAEAARELAERLSVPFKHIVVPGQPA